uniref:Uncharacterized protein n=1 Tax=Caulobacter sp. (strain K31) TaxID=366602 RepID=B0T4D9_CAUSK
MSSDQRGRDPVTKLFGALLMTVGALMMALCGLCSLVFVVSGVGGDWRGTLLLVLIFGGVPIGVGFLAFWFGRRLRAPSGL